MPHNSGRGEKGLDRTPRWMYCISTVIAGTGNSAWRLVHAAVLTLTARAAAKINHQARRKQESSHGGLQAQQQTAAARCAGNHRCIVRGGQQEGGLSRKKANLQYCVEQLPKRDKGRAGQSQSQSHWHWAACRESTPASRMASSLASRPLLLVS